MITDAQAKYKLGCTYCSDAIQTNTFCRVRAFFWYTVLILNRFEITVPLRKIVAEGPKRQQFLSFQASSHWRDFFRARQT